MQNYKIEGYVRENGRVGIRNYVLILSITHGSHLLSSKIGETVAGVKVFIPEDEDGRTKQDRQTIARTLIGLGINPNVHSVLLVCSSRAVAYQELSCNYIEGSIKKSGKHVEVLEIDECGGFYNALGEGIKKARSLVLKASFQSRQKMDFGSLFIGVKCGLSDATSGIAGNPTVGYLGDQIVDANGTFVFSETTEVIGAEHILARRCVNKKVKEQLLEAVKKVEEDAIATGEDIRTINPIPANIEAGITTLEEKSIGAIIKGGTSPLQGVISYGEQPKATGLYFMDSWMSSTSLFLGYAAAGAVLGIFQMGGGAFPKDPVMPAIGTGIVAPILYVTGNHRTYKKAEDEIDFNAGTVISQKKPIEEVGKELCSYICHIASGRMTKAETLLYQDRVEISLKGPAL